MMEISFIVPTLNEVKNVPLVLDLIAQSTTLTETTYEVIFVDDKSTDGTIDLILSLSSTDPRIRLIISPERKGLGHALKLGIAAGKMKLVLLLDCDVSIQKEDLIKLLKNATPEKMLIGSRYIKGGQTIGAPAVKVFISKCLNWAISRYLKIPAVDISHSLRVFSPQNLAMPKNNTHPAFFWELSIKGQHHGLNVCELPITFRERRHGQSKNVTRKMIKSVLQGFRTIAALKSKN